MPIEKSMCTALLETMFTLVISGFCQAETVPFGGSLKPEFRKIYSELEQATATDSRKALSLSRTLMLTARSTQDEASKWATLTYTYLLLENDSIIKAESILRDSTGNGWNNMSPWLQAYHSLNLASAYGYIGKYAKAEKLYTAHLNTKMELADHPELNYLLISGWAENLRYQGKLDLSLVRWFEVLDMGESSGDSAQIADAHLGLGTIRFLQNDLGDAQQHIELFHRYYKRIGNQKKMANGLSVLGLIEYQQQHYEESVRISLESYQIRRRIGDTKGQGESLNNLALGYMGLKNWAQAFRYLEQATQMKMQANDLTQMTVILNNMGHCQRLMGNFDRALAYFELALQKGKENGQMGDVVRSYENLIKLHSKTEDFRSAFETQTELTHLQDSIAKAERDEAITELKIKYETDNVEQQLKLLEQEKSLITNRWLSLALGLFMAIIIGLLFIDNQKRKHRQEKELLGKEDELQKAELKIMGDLLEYNRTKLQLYTENLLKKSELVTELEDKVRQSGDHVSENAVDSKKNIKDFTRVRILTDADWAEFKQLFESVHQGLLQRLVSTNQQLTLADQRLFLLMKLNLSTKEIADILGVSPDTVKKGRYRLKKKVGLKDETSLQEFVSSF
jgi:tetratricopeptide (TPR) repeat protein